MKKDIIENEEVKEEKQEMVVASFGSLANSSKTRKRTYTTIDLNDTKKLYNLDKGEITNLINDFQNAESFEKQNDIIKSAPPKGYKNEIIF